LIEHLEQRVFRSNNLSPILIFTGDLVMMHYHMVPLVCFLIG